MKVLYLIHQFFPTSYLGTEKFLLNLTTSMQKWGHKVKVISYSSYKNSYYEKKETGFLWKEYVYKSIPVLGYKQHSEPPSLHWDIGNPALIQFAERILEREQPDLLHIVHGMRVSSFAFAAQRLGLPYAMTLTDFFYLCPKCKLFTSQGTLCTGPEQGEACRTFCPEFKNDAIRNRLKLSEDILRGAKSVVAPSRTLGGLFKKEFPWLNLKVIPYGIDYSRIERNQRTYNGQGKLVVLYAGQIDFHKGVHVLVEAVKRIPSKNIEVRIFGSGPPLVEQQIKHMAKSDGRIRFCGVYSEDEIGEVFGDADVVVIPSIWHENNTIVMREALAAHVPCIVSNAGGMMEMIQEGKNGFVFRMGDAQHLKEVLQRVLDQPDLLSSMKENVASYVVTSVEQEAYAYEEEYRRIVRKS